MTTYSLNIAKATGTHWNGSAKVPTFTHWALVEFGRISHSEAKAKAQDVVEAFSMMGGDWSFRLTETKPAVGTSWDLKVSHSGE